MKTPQKNIIDNWLAEHGDPEIASYVENNLALTEKIRSILNERGIKLNEFAVMLNKKSSEVSKWLSGNHNLTFKNIIKIQYILGVNLINIEAKTEYVYLGSIPGGNIKEAINEYEETKTDYIFDKAV